MWNTIFFDLDGTLTDPGEGIIQSVQRALTHFDIHVEDLTELHCFVGPPLRDSFKRFYGFDDAGAEEVAKVYQGYFRGEGMAKNRIYSGIPELLASLKDTGKELVLATSKPLVFAREILERFQIDQYFSFVAGAELDGRRSRKAEVIAYGLEGAGIEDKANVVMVGDREYDIFGAEEMGLGSIGVLYGYGGREELEAAGADHIVDSVAELGKLLLEKRP